MTNSKVHPTQVLPPITKPTIIPRPEHNISRADISAGALKVLYTLKKADFDAYLVGGGVRDLLLEREPKDFDIVTDAKPEQIRELFRTCRLIGRRFRLAHVRFGREVIEVATFRAAVSGPEHDDRVSVNGRLLRDNVYGTLEEDVWRRDLSINSLYYNIRDFSVVDYAGGVRDLRDGLIRLIGDPQVRYREDPVRLLRALRFAAKLDFDIAPETETPMLEHVELLRDIPPARLYDEVLKLFMGGTALRSFDLLVRYRALAYLFPATAKLLEHDTDGARARFLRQGLLNTDERIAEDKPVTPAFLFAVFLWEPVSERAQRHIASGMSEVEAFEAAGAEVVAKQAEQVALPRRFSLVAREIWNLQPRLLRIRGQRALRMLELKRFRAGYDFLLLRTQSGEDLGSSAAWWTKLQASDGEARKAMLTHQRPRRRRRRRRAQLAPSAE